MIKIIIFDFEVFKYDWLVCWLDTKTKKTYSIINDRDKFIKFYEYYKSRVWVGYNSRGYDQWIAKGILADFNPWEINDWIINQDKKGFEFSKTLNNFPIITYDVSVFGRSLKQLEAFMGHDIRESNVTWDIDRPLTDEELKDTIQYCKHDVWETFEIFVQNKEDYETHLDIINKYNLGKQAIGKTQTQLTAMVLDGNKVKRDDEFEITIPKNIQLGKYEFVKDYYINWALNDKSYDTMSLETEIAGVPHKFGVGGIHGATEAHMGDGYYIMADVTSYYPALMILYDFFSRSTSNAGKIRFKELFETNLKLKKQGKKKQRIRYKLLLNKTFGALKDLYNSLYDPLQSNNICIAGQLFLVDLIEKLEGKCQLIQSNTDGIMIKLYHKDDKEEIMKICNEWSIRTGLMLDFDYVKKVIQRDVNNYIIVYENDYVKRKGAVVKETHPLDNNRSVINNAIVDYFVNDIPVMETIQNTLHLIDFQLVGKIGNKYEYGVHNDQRLVGKVNRTFASLDLNDSTLYKKHKLKDTVDKVAGIPDHCFIVNENILDKEIPDNLDKQWYINTALREIESFI